MRDGRPLRFLGVTMLGWASLRAAMLWPGAEPIAPLIRALAPPLAAATLAPPLRTVPQAVPIMRGFRVRAAVVTKAVEMARVAVAEPPAEPPQRTTAQPTEMPSVLSAPFGPTVAPRASRLAGSAWLLTRGGPGGTLSGGQLGASQAGVRLTYALGQGRRVALTARFATPLSGAGKEAAFGFEWKPTRLPVRLIAEERVVLDGGRGGPTVGVIAGYGPAAIAPGLRIEAYGQAGAIARDGVEGFVDTAARLAHPTASIGHSKLDLGIGAWGSAQRGAARFDFGPTAGLAVPVAARTIRLTFDWRVRVAGNARPGTGPALTIGSDF